MMDADLFISSKVALSVEQIRSLFDDLVTANFLIGPFVIITGELPLGQPSCLPAMPTMTSVQSGEMTYERHDSLTSLVPAIQKLHNEAIDFALRVPALNWDNDELRAEFESRDWSNGEFALFCLAKPTVVSVWDGDEEREHKWQTYCTMSGKGIPGWESCDGLALLSATTLGPILKKYFGAKPKVDMAFW